MKLAVSVVLSALCACASSHAVHLEQSEALGKDTVAPSARRVEADFTAEWSKLSPSESRLVKVVDGVTGVPVAGAWVEIAVPEYACMQEQYAWTLSGPSIDDWLARFGRRARTNEQGEVRVPLPTSLAEWVVAHDGARFGSFDPLLDQQDFRLGVRGRDVVRIRLLRDEKALVRVTTASGLAPIGAVVYLEFHLDGVRVESAGEKPWWCARVQDTGDAIEMPHVQELRRRCPGGAEPMLVAGLIALDAVTPPVPVSLAEGAALDISAPDCGSIHVRMRRADGAPTSSLAYGYVTYLDEPFRESDEDEIEYPEPPFVQSGDRARIDGVPLGQRFRLEGIAGDDLRPVTLEVAGPERPGQVVEVELVARELLPKVRARLVDASGQPLGHVAVWTSAETEEFEEQGGNLWIPRWTDAAGYVVFPVRCSNDQTPGRVLEFGVWDGVEPDDRGMPRPRAGIDRPLELNARVPFERARSVNVVELGTVVMEPRPPR